MNDENIGQLYAVCSVTAKPVSLIGDTAYQLDCDSPLRAELLAIESRMESARSDLVKVIRRFRPYYSDPGVLCS